MKEKQSVHDYFFATHQNNFRSMLAKTLMNRSYFFALVELGKSTTMPPVNPALIAYVVTSCIWKTERRGKNLVNRGCMETWYRLRIRKNCPGEP